MLQVLPYVGGKSAAGTFQRIINLIPPHRVYVEPFAGGAAILRMKRPAEESFAIDLDAGALAQIEAARLPGVTTLLDCGMEWMERHTWTGEEFVYCDPPYVHASRGRFRYRYEMSDADHVRLLRVLVTLPCPVLLSGYPSKLYASEGFGVPGRSARSGAAGLRPGWHCETFRAMTRGHTWRTECLWRNYARPAALHDLRFVGIDYRDRWRIAKRRRRWRARLAKLDPLERATLFAALVDVMGPDAVSGAVAGALDPRAENGATRENR